MVNLKKLARWVEANIEPLGVYQDESLILLEQFGLQYDRARHVLGAGDCSIVVPVQHSSELAHLTNPRASGEVRASHGAGGLNGGWIQPGDWYGVVGDDLVRALCALLGLGDPAEGYGGPLHRHRAYLQALKVAATPTPNDSRKTQKP